MTGWCSRIERVRQDTRLSKHLESAFVVIRWKRSLSHDLARHCYLDRSDCYDDLAHTDGGTRPTTAPYDQHTNFDRNGDDRSGLFYFGSAILDSNRNRDRYPLVSERIEERTGKWMNDQAGTNISWDSLAQWRLDQPVLAPLSEQSSSLTSELSELVTMAVLRARLIALMQAAIWSQTTASELSMQRLMHSLTLSNEVRFEGQRCIVRTTLAFNV